VYLIGLTGNIATGKSTVAQILAELGAQVIDADKIAHQVMDPGTHIWRRVVESFGKEIVGPDGYIDRFRLGERVFADPAQLRQLECIVHPAVRQEIDRILRFLPQEKSAGASCTARAVGLVVVIEAIKLVESGLADRCDAVWVVSSNRDRQVCRLTQTRALSEAAASLRVDAQPPQADKVARGDVVIANNGTLSELRERVLSEWQKLVDEGVASIPPP
jgi:dephospho-CoA kinase